MSVTKEPWSVFDEEDSSGGDQAYFELVNDRFDSEKESTLANSNPAHAIYILRKFLDRAERDVKVYSGCLQLMSTKTSHQGLQLYSDPHLIDSFEKFLKRCPECTLQIVVEKEIDRPSDGEHPLLSMIRSLNASDFMKGTASIRKINADFLERMKEHDANRHLIMVDSRYIRVEINHEDSAAVVVFHDLETISQLTKFYDKLLWENSTPIELSDP